MCDDARLIDAAEQLLGGPVIPECPEGVLYFSEAGWHTDDGIGVRGVKFAAYFDELTARNGALRMVPGSHHPEQNARLAAYSRRRGLARTDAEAAAYQASIPGYMAGTSPGDVITFDLHTWHASAAHEPAIAAAVRAADARAHEQLEGLIAAGVRAGEWPDGTDAALAARLFTAGLYGLTAQWYLAPGSFSWDVAAAALAGHPAPAGGGSAASPPGPGQPPAVPVASGVPVTWKTGPQPDGRRAESLTGPARQVHQAVLAAFARTGQPPARSELEQIARSLGASPGEVLAEPAGADAIAFSPGGDIRAAYPFSPVRVAWAGGPAAYAMCAIDALGMSAMLGRPVTIIAAEPDTGRPMT